VSTIERKKYKAKTKIVMKTNIIFALLSLCILLSSCKKDDDNINPINQDPVILSSLEAGQTSHYVRYHMQCGDAPGFEWTLDTLVLEVIKNDVDEYFLQESLTPHSPMFLNGGFQEPVRYQVRPINDGLLIPQRESSALFFFYANDTLRLAPVHDVTLTQDACKLQQDSQPFIGNDIGFIPNLEYGSIRIEDQTVVSCEPFFNLDAYLVYADNQLNMSHVVTLEGGVIEPGEEEVYGWCRIR